MARGLAISLSAGLFLGIMVSAVMLFGALYCLG